MARYEHIETSSPLLPVDLARPLFRGTFSHALDVLHGRDIDLSHFDARYRNDSTGAPRSRRGSTHPDRRGLVVPGGGAGPVQSGGCRLVDQVEDDGPEFVSKAILQWMIDQNIQTALIDPGKPWQNGTDESFNGKFRDECLSVEWFRSRREAVVIIEAWRRHCNHVRPHSSFEYHTPAEFRRRYEFINPGATLKHQLA
jgi:hypothetical protein